MRRLLSAALAAALLVGCGQQTTTTETTAAPATAAPADPLVPVNYARSLMRVILAQDGVAWCEQTDLKLLTSPDQSLFENGTYNNPQRLELNCKRDAAENFDPQDGEVLPWAESVYPLNYDETGASLLPKQEDSFFGQELPRPAVSVERADAIANATAFRAVKDKKDRDKGRTQVWRVAAGENANNTLTVLVKDGKPTLAGLGYNEVQRPDTTTRNDDALVACLERSGGLVLFDAGLPDQDDSSQLDGLGTPPPFEDDRGTTGMAFDEDVSGLKQPDVRLHALSSTPLAGRELRTAQMGEGDPTNWDMLQMGSLIFEVGTSSQKARIPKAITTALTGCAEDLKLLPVKHRRVGP